MLPREQRIHANSSFRCNFLEAVAHQLVGYEDLALLLRQFVERLVQFLEEHVSCVGGIGSGIRGWKQVFQREFLAFFGGGPSCSSRAFPALFPEAIRDPIASDAKEPCCQLLNWFQEAIRLNQFVEHVLQDVFRIFAVGYTLSNEAAQSTTLKRDCLRDSLILACHRPLFSQRLSHL